jgi:hypothetical protein
MTIYLFWNNTKENNSFAKKQFAFVDPVLLFIDFSRISPKEKKTCEWMLIGFLCFCRMSSTSFVKEKKKKQKWIGLCIQCLTVYPVKSNYRPRFCTHRQSTMDERSDRYVRRGWTRSYLIFMPSWHSFVNVTTDDNEATLPPHRKRKPNSLSRRCHDDEGIKSGKIKMAKFRTGELVIWADIKTKQTGTYTEYRSRNGCVCLSRFYEP